MANEQKDLYALLGVGAKASAGEIHSAYRRAAARTHPDVHGGNREEFERIKLAHDVLSNENRRARYDATGKYNSTDPDNVEARALQMLAGMLRSIAMSAAKVGMDMRFIDVVGGLREVAESQRGEYQRAEREMSETLAKAQTMKERTLRPGGGENVLARLIEREIEAIVAGIGEAKESAAAVDHVCKLLNDYRYDRTVLDPLLGNPFGASSNTSASHQRYQNAIWPNRSRGNRL